MRTKKEIDAIAWMKDVIPQDLVKFGLIPELVGRLPVITSLSGLDKNSLVRILTEPKNSIMKQYTKLFALDRVDLEFEEDALKAVAQKAIDRNTGARGIRSIMEEILSDLMYKVPSDHTIEKVIITKDTVEKNADAKIVRNPDREPMNIAINNKKSGRNTRSSNAS